MTEEEAGIQRLFFLPQAPAPHINFFFQHTYS